MLSEVFQWICITDTFLGMNILCISYLTGFNKGILILTLVTHVHVYGPYRLSDVPTDICASELSH